MGVKVGSQVYYPFFRGKQYELIAIRENAVLLRNSGFVPIVEPVKESLNGLVRTVAEVEKASGHVIVIVNPNLGDHSGDTSAIQALLDGALAKSDSVMVGVLATGGATLQGLQKLCSQQGARKVVLIHSGFDDGRVLAEGLSNCANLDRHVFLEESCGKLYRKHFKGSRRILVRDGFQRRVNREHPPLEHFSDLHVTFGEEGMDGFGDFLVVGDDFAESGGPAYAVAIHITFIDDKKDDSMFVHHFVSDRTDTPTDPAGKFSEAVRKLVLEVERPGTGIERTDAVNEFLELHRKAHFPGLGYVKKLSMQHHIETLAHFFKKP